MSNFAKVLCLLLMVAATSVSAWSILTPMKRSFTIEMDALAAQIDSAHKYAYSNLSKIMTKVEKKSIEESARKYSSEVTEEAVIKCIEEELEVLADRQRRINTTRLEALHRVKLRKIMAKTCTCSCTFLLFRLFRARACFKKILALTAKSFQEVELILAIMVKDMTMRSVRLVENCRKSAEKAIGSAEDPDGNENTSGE